MANTKTTELTIQITRNGDSYFEVTALEGRYKGKERGLGRALEELARNMYKRRGDLGNLRPEDLSETAVRELRLLYEHLGVEVKQD